MNAPKITRRVVLQGTSAAALTALLAACAPQRSSGDKPGTTPSGTFSAQEIDELVVAIPSTLSSLYPGSEAGNFNYYVAALIAEGLVAPDGTGKLVPALAESWEQTSPTTYVYTIRQDAKFSDGTAMTVDDVVYSINLARSDKASPNIAYYWANTKDVKATGDNEVTITLASPDVAFEWGPCAANALWITSQAYVEAHDGQLGTVDALFLGTGPYKVTKFEPDSTVELERVDTWWGGKPPVAKIRIDFISEENTRLLARRSGDIDMAMAISLDQAQQWEDTPDTAVQFAPDRSFVCIDFNTAVEPFDDIHVRRAIAMCADRQAYIDKLLGGHGEIATALTTPQQIEAAVGGEDAARAKLAEVIDLTYDLEGAKAELAQSKVPDGFSCKVGVSTSAPQISQAFQALAQITEQIGITIEVKEMPVEKWYGTIGSPDWGLAYMWYFNATGDPGELSSWFLAEGNPGSYTNPAVDDLMQQQREETDPAKRVDLIVKTQQTALADLPYYPLWWGEAATAINDTYTIDEFGSYTFLSPWAGRVLTKDA